MGKETTTADLRIEKLAETLVDYSVAVREGDRVLINGSSLAEPLLKEIYARVLQAGGHPMMMLSLPGAEEIFFRHASDEQLKHVPKPLELVIETYDVRISVLADSNTKALSNVDADKLVMQQRARTDLMSTFMRRSASGELRWTVAPFPTNAFAQDAEMSLSEYDDFVYGACLPDLDDPVGYWQRFSARQAKIITRLEGKTKVHVTGPGTDLHLSIAGREFMNCDGHFNMPDGEIFTGPVEDSIEGFVSFSYPAIYGGREVTGVRLWFEQGKVVKASADKNEDFLLKTLDTDDGARYVGEFAIGTNEGITRFTREILFDEKISGSFHMALGAGYPETGSKNESAIHWDMICDLRDGGEIRLDDECIYRNGEFMIDI
ncbi:MAG: aminopeptidase [Dehalococcoidales bacterium]|nr:aminopeptidase [Dehalococcoidales bacterium]